MYSRNSFLLFQCKPGYAGNGFHCGDDSDSDGIPDKNLPCGEKECRSVSPLYLTVNTIFYMLVKNYNAEHKGVTGSMELHHNAGAVDN